MEVPPPRDPSPSGGTRQPSTRGKYQVRKRDREHPIAPPEDADQHDEGRGALEETLKELNDPNVAVVKRRVRRIHLRWYHGVVPQMIRVLEMIGCPETTHKLVQDVVATCRVCRTWVRRAPDVKLAVRLSIRFNQCVQVDLMFYECAATPLGSSSSLRPPSEHYSSYGG